MLREKITEMLELFDKFEIPEEKQRRIITNGVSFCFDYDAPLEVLNAFEFADVLEKCITLDIPLDVNEMLENTCNTKYKILVDMAKTIDVAAKTFAKRTDN